MKRLDQLTFTRFIIIMLVLFYHGDGGVYYDFLKQFPFSELLRTAPTGVSYLYILSGFVMVIVYFRPNEKFDIGAYWRARFVRIYPLYLIAFLLTCYYYLDSMLRIKPQKILSNLFVIQSWIPAYSQSFNYASWSMTVEFFFYAIFPFFTIWAYQQSTKKLINFSIILWAVSQIIYHILWIGYFPERKDFIVYFPIFHLNSFIMGVVGGIWYLREGSQQNIKPNTIFIALMTSFLFIAGYGIISLRNYPFFPRDLQPMAGLLAPVLILFIIALALDKSRLSKILNHPALVTFGETSYVIYILHVPIVWVYHRFLETSSWVSVDPQQFFNITVLPMMIAIGLITHFYIDLPLRAWLKKALQHINIPLLFLDLILVTVSIYISFRLRFENQREYESYREMGRLMYYYAFFLRPALAIYFKTFNLPAFTTFTQMIRPLIISTTLGSIILGIIMYIGFSIGSFENFPRSVFLTDWLIILSSSILTRFLSYKLKNKTS